MHGCNFTLLTTPQKGFTEERVCVYERIMYMYFWLWSSWAGPYIASRLMNSSHRKTIVQNLLLTHMWSWQILAEEFSHTILHRRRPQQPVGGVGGGVSAFRPVGGGQIGVVGRPLPPAPRPQPIPKLAPPPQPAAPPNRKYNPSSVYGGAKKEADEKWVEEEY